MAGIGLAARVLSIALVCSACGGASEGDDPAPNAGGSTGASGSSNAGGNSSGGGNGGSGDGGAVGGQSSGGTAAEGGSSAAGAAGSGVVEETDPGTVTDLWSEFCIATFTEDYAVLDPFGDPMFTAKAGEEYLLLDYPTPYRSATAAYLTSIGPIDFDIEPNTDNTSFPFTSNCAPDPPLTYFAVFADVTVFAEPELVTEICALQAGDAVLRDEMAASGYAVETIGDESAVYEIFLNAFSAQCGGAQNGYVSVPMIHALGSDRVLVPFASVPAEN